MHVPLRAATAFIVLCVLVLAPTGRSAAASPLTREPAVETRVAARWAWPVPPPHTVLRPFVAPATRYSAGHRGIDVAAAPGTVVTAPDDGTVVFAGRLVDRGVLSIQHAGGVRSSFEPVTALVHAGDHVNRGQPVGVVAPAGAHPAGSLYIGARVVGQYVSPLLFLGGQTRAVLLPLDSG